MIVDIHVPSVDGLYEFRLNDDTIVSVVIEEICSVICEREQCELSGNVDMMFLYDERRGQKLIRTLTLYENGVISGDRLLLI